MNSALAATSTNIASVPANRPYTLLRLQKDASHRYGYSAKQVLSIAESLYERGLITYPRSNIEHVPDNQYIEYARMAKDINRASGQALCSPLHKGDCWLDAENFPYEHTAILPTPLSAAAMCYAVLTPEQVNLYRLICEGLIAMFTLPAA